MIWVFSRAGEILDVTVLKCVHCLLETSFSKDIDAQEKRSHVLHQKSFSPI